MLAQLLFVITVSFYKLKQTRIEMLIKTKENALSAHFLSPTSSFEFDDLEAKESANLEIQYTDKKR